LSVVTQYPEITWRHGEKAARVLRQFLDSVDDGLARLREANEYAGQNGFQDLEFLLLVDFGGDGPEDVARLPDEVCIDG
jgi:hypothetical protein